MAATQCIQASRCGEDDLLKFNPSIRMGKKGDLSDFERGMVAGARQVVFCTMYVYVQPQEGSAENSTHDSLSACECVFVLSVHTPPESVRCLSCHWFPWRRHFQTARRTADRLLLWVALREAAGRTQRTDARCPLHTRKNTYYNKCISMHTWFCCWRASVVPNRPFLAGLTMDRSLHGLPPITRSNGPHSWICSETERDVTNVSNIKTVRDRDQRHVLTCLRVMLLMSPT